MIVTGVSEQNKIPPITPAPLESIHPGVSSLLEKIGAAGAESEATRALYSGIYANGMYTPLGEDEKGKWQGMHIDRDIFNSQMLLRIQQGGVQVIFNEKVEDFILQKVSRSNAVQIPPYEVIKRESGEQVERSEDPAIRSHEAGEQGAGNTIIGIKTVSTELYAKYIIDASGKNGIAGKKLNFKRKFFSPPLACWTGISAIDGTFSFDPHAAHFIPGPGGWTWLAPQPQDFCAWTRLSTTGDKSLLPPDELRKYQTTSKINFANMRWRLFRPVCSEGIVLCGDAAGILDPAAGQGIFNALLSGITAANTIISCIQKPDAANFQLAYYDDWFVRQFEEKVRQLKRYYNENSINIF